jgi:3-oxoacyl-[acyl-carrier-protein] synthase-3
MNIRITGTGAYIPTEVVPNSSFTSTSFYDATGNKVEKENEEIIEKFKAITGIEERRYLSKNLQTSDMASIASRRAIEASGINPETLDGIIFAHNFGNIPGGKVQTDILPSLASRVKHDLGIENPNCVAYDILFGCPGWVQGLIIARNYMLAGEGKKFLVIGAEALSRVLDPHDRDSMIYADGAAASVLEADEDLERRGVLSVASQTYAKEEAYYLYYDKSYNAALEDETRYIKMHGHKIYEFALSRVPAAMQLCLDKSGLDISQVKKILIHQANEKMDEAIVKRFYRLYKKPVPEGIMPMTIHYLGNSSVATVPTLLDILLRDDFEGHQLNKGDIVLMASVGAGMNINAITYKI